MTSIAYVLVAVIALPHSQPGVVVHPHAMTRQECEKQASLLNTTIDDPSGYYNFAICKPVKVGD